MTAPAAASESTHTPPPIRLRMLDRPAQIWIAAYVALTLCTGAFFMADTVDYVSSVLQHEQGMNPYFWDFRHLFWRPLGWILFHWSNLLVNYQDPFAARAGVIHIFVALNWIAGLFSIVLLRQVLGRFCHQKWALNFALLALLFAQGFMNYVHAGSPYIFALGLLITALYFLCAEPGELSFPRVLAGALALALSVCFWFPYLFAVIGALATPLFVSRQNWRATLRATILCFLFGIAFYGTVILHLHLRTVADITHWITAYAIDVVGVNGPKRVVFGLARSFLNMGQDGVLYKRFMLHDPYNPVSLAALFRLSILKLAIFYLLLAAIGWELWRLRSNRRILLLSLLGAAPVVMFGLFWYGGDVERYLPLYPFFLLALGCALESRPALWTKVVAALFLATAIISNVSAMSRLTLGGQQKRSENRLEPLMAAYTAGSRVIVVDIHDDLVNFARSFPLSPAINRSDFSYYSVLNVGTSQTLHWRRDLARTVLSAWQKGGDIWLSNRLFERHPRPDSAWVEGEDPRVKWSDVYGYFSMLETGSNVGGDDGFVLLLPDQKNRELLAGGTATSQNSGTLSNAR